MKENKYVWATLLRKFVDNKINDAELEELFRQMKANDLKFEQFDQVTEPDYYPKLLKEYLDDELSGKNAADLKRFQAMYDAHIRSKNK